jgi:hypothetical protein
LGHNTLHFGARHGCEALEDFWAQTSVIVETFKP